MPQKPPPEGQSASLAFSVAAGLFFFLVIIKFGDPVIMDYNATAPPGFMEGVFESWPSRWGPYLLAPLVALAFLTSPRKRLARKGRDGSPSRPSPLDAPWNRLGGHWPLALPALWLVWELLAGTHSIGPKLTSVTLAHFTICVILFYLGCFALDRDA